MDETKGNVINELAKVAGGTIEEVAVLPDGSGFAVLSLPLPANHWSTVPGDNVPPMPFRRGTDDPTREEWAEKIRAAGRYAFRCATMNGSEADMDPDALIQNLVVGMLGYWTPDGYSADVWGNPQREEQEQTPRERILALIAAELDRAYAKHGREPWGRHEFFGIIREEFDEMWEDIKADAPMEQLRKEIVQVAAMCFRYLETGDRYGHK